MKQKVETVVMETTIARKALIGLRKMAHNHKCSVANIVRGMIYHHLDVTDYGIYVARPPRHRCARVYNKRLGREEASPSTKSLDPLFRKHPKFHH